MSKTFGC